MKSCKQMITAVTVLVTGSVLAAGDLTPPGPPAPTMHTLEEIYEKVEHLGPTKTLSDDTIVVEAGSYAGTTLLAVDPDMVASNIRAGVVIFGIAGTYIGADSPTNPPLSGMALIPVGSFSMGDAFSPEGDSDELPVHSVSVSSFYMDTTEVTKAEWDSVRTWAMTNSYSFSSGWAAGTAHPVVEVNWYDCVKWANALSEMEGLAPCYTVSGATYKTGEYTPDCNWSVNGYRLPTEAEWEKAARGGASGRRFPWSNSDSIQHTRANYFSTTSYDYDTSSTRGYHPDYSSNYPSTSPAGSFAPNDYGLYDMAGNVREWCWDWYDSGFYSVSSGTDPRGPVTGFIRVIRDGCWDRNAYQCRVADRDSDTPDNNYEAKNDLGIRLVRAVQ